MAKQPQMTAYVMSFMVPSKIIGEIAEAMHQFPTSAFTLERVQPITRITKQANGHEEPQKLLEGKKERAPRESGATLEATIMKILKEAGGPLARTILRERVVAAGVKASSMDARLTKLFQTRRIKRVEPGVYQFAKD